MIDYDIKPGTFRGLIEVYASASAVDGYPAEWFWRAKGRNGQKTGSGHESFTRRAEAVAAVDRLLSAQLIGSDPAPIDVVVPWRLVVLNRDGSTYREGSLY